MRSVMKNYQAIRYDKVLLWEDSPLRGLHPTAETLCCKPLLVTSNVIGCTDFYDKELQALGAL